MNPDYRGINNTSISPENISEETENTIEDFKDFLLSDEVMPFISDKQIEKMSPAEMLSILEEYWNEPASVKAFIKLMSKIGGLNHKELDEDSSFTDLLKGRMGEVFQTYLFNKLPHELKKKWQNWLDEGTKGYEDLLKAVSKKDSGLILGYHTSPRDIRFTDDGVAILSPSFSKDTFSGPGDKKAIDAAKAWYSLSKDALYQEKSPKFLYLVEGSRGDVDTERHYDKAQGAIWRSGNLTLRGKIPLNKETKKQFDLQFGEF